MILFLIVLLLILNPYTVVGPLGYYVGLPIAGIAFFHGGKIIDREVFFLFFVCILISVFGVLSSVWHSIGQVEHIKVAISIFVYYLIGIGLWLIYGKKVDIEELLLLMLLVGILNGIVILIQIQFPQFRSIVESVFVESGNVDWTEGFRYRGLASGGGASLSVLSAFMVYICLFLYGIKEINVFFTIPALVILILSVLFIGRTGVLLIGVGFFLYILVQGVRNIKIFTFILMIFLFFIFFGFDYIEKFLVNQFGEEFYQYSFGFFLQGQQGIENEGTAGMIAEFLVTLPSEFPEILIGYGFYGDGYFFPWTDSGYARMFLSVGFVFGFIFYASIFFIFRKSVHKRKMIFVPLIILLVIAETKEALMFSGYASRLLFILIGFFVAQAQKNKFIK